MERNTDSENKSTENRENYLAENKLRSEKTPNRETPRRLSRKGRRGFLSALAGFGISAASIRGLSREALAKEDPRQEIPFTAKYRVKNIRELQTRDSGQRLEMEAVQERVSRDVWARRKGVQKAASKVRSNLRSKTSAPFRVGVGVGKNNNQIVEVQIPNLPESHSREGMPVSEHVPDQASASVKRGNGKSPEKFTVPVRSRTVSYKDAKANCGDLEDTWHYDTSYSEIPGGAMLTATRPNNNNEWGTTCTPVYSHSKGKYVMLTAGHVVWSEGNLYNKKRTDIYQPCQGVNSEQVGETGPVSTFSEDYYDDFNGDGTQDYTIYDPNGLDAATFEPVNGYSTDYSLANDNGGTNEIIGGYWTWEKIQQEVGNTSATKQGAITERETGEIMFADDSNEWFVTGAETIPGDSGGPHFVQDADSSLNDVNIVGCTSAQVDFDDNGYTSSDGGSAFSIGRILSSSNHDISFI